MNSYWQYTVFNGIRRKVGNAMKKLLQLRMLPLFLCLVITVFTCFLSIKDVKNVYGITSGEINDAKNEKEQKEQEQKNIQEELDNYKKQSETTKEYIAKLDGAMSELDGQIYDVNNNIERLTQEIEETQNNLDIAIEDADEQYKMMKLRIQYMYERNEESFLAALLQSTSMGELLNRAEYYTKISSYDRQQLERYQSTIEFIKVAKQELEDNYAELDNLKASLEQQRTDMEYMLAEKQKEMQNLDTQIANAQNKETELASSIGALDDEIDAMEKKLAAQEEEERRKQEANNQSSLGGNVVGTGAWLWPTISRRVTSDFGVIDDPIRGDVPHKGVDIGARTPGVSGDPIYAVDNGVVAVAESNQSAGNWIWISHGNGLYSVYMHNSKLLVSVGQTVNKGDTIALMGTTGQSNGVHLHIAARLNGTYVNPWTYLK